MPNSKHENTNKYKIYISPMTGINIDSHNRISTSDNRLLRRIIRDNRTRGHKVEKTLETWNYYNWIYQTYGINLQQTITE